MFYVAHMRADCTDNIPLKLHCVRHYITTKLTFSLFTKCCILTLVAPEIRTKISCTNTLKLGSRFSFRVLFLDTEYLLVLSTTYVLNIPPTDPIF